MNVYVDNIAEQAFALCDKFGITHPSHRERFAEGYRAGLRINLWHKASEEPPPHFGDYLVIIDSKQFGRRYDIKCWYGNPGDPFNDKPSKEWVLEDDEIVSYWMPIPEIKDDCYDNMPYNLADMFEKVIRESDANPQIIIEKLKNAFEYD